MRVSFTVCLWDSLLMGLFCQGGILTVNLANDLNPAEERMPLRQCIYWWMDSEIGYSWILQDMRECAIIFCCNIIYIDLLWVEQKYIDRTKNYYFYTVYSPCSYFSVYVTYLQALERYNKILSAVSVTPQPSGGRTFTVALCTVGLNGVHMSLSYSIHFINSKANGLLRSRTRNSKMTININTVTFFDWYYYQRKN